MTNSHELRDKSPAELLAEESEPQSKQAEAPVEARTAPKPRLTTEESSDSGPVGRDPEATNFGSDESSRS
jgi:hypothetical protein